MDDLKKPEVFAAYYEKVYRELYYFALHTLKNNFNKQEYNDKRRPARVKRAGGI